MSSAEVAVAVAAPATAAGKKDSMDGLNLNKPKNWKRMHCKNAQDVFNFFIDHMPRIESSRDRLGFLEYQSRFFPNNMYYRNPHTAFDIVQYILACFPRDDSKYRYKALTDLVCRVELMPQQYSREQMLTLINLVRGDDNCYMVKTSNLLTHLHDIEYKWIMNSETAGLILATLPDDDLRWRQVLYWMKHLNNYEGFLTIPNGQSGREWIGHQFKDQKRGQLIIEMIKATAIPGANKEEAYEAAMAVLRWHQDPENATKVDAAAGPITGKQRPRSEDMEPRDSDQPPMKVGCSKGSPPSATVVIDA